MSLFRREAFEPRELEISAAEAPLASEPFLPDNLDILVFYGCHDEKKDFKSVQPYLDTADIYVPELPYWSPEQVSLFSRISQGDKSARDKLEQEVGGNFTAFSAATIKWLLGSNIYITPIDYAAHHDRAEEIRDHFVNWSLLDRLVPSFNKTLSAIDEYAKKEGELEDYREDIMLKSLGPRLQALISGSPELSRQERIPVVVQLGTTHTFLYHNLLNLVKANPTCTVNRVFADTKPIIFEHFDRLARSHRAGIEIDRQRQQELAVRALARTGLKYYNRGGIPLVIYSGESRLHPPSPEEMTNRIDIATVKDFHRRAIRLMKSQG